MPAVRQRLCIPLALDALPLLTLPMKYTARRAALGRLQSSQPFESRCRPRASYTRPTDWALATVIA